MSFLSSDLGQGAPNFSRNDFEYVHHILKYWRSAEVGRRDGIVTTPGPKFCRRKMQEENRMER